MYEDFKIYVNDQCYDCCFFLQILNRGMKEAVAIN